MSYSAGLREGIITAPETPHQVIQVVADTHTQEWAKNQAVSYEQKKIPYKINPNDLKQFNIYAGELLFALNPEYYRQFGISQPTGSRQAVLSSAVGLPAFTQDQSTAHLTESELNTLAREKLESFVSFWGASQGNYYGQEGPEKSSQSTGFTSMHSGVKTVVCFSKSGMAPGTKVRLGFVPQEDRSTGSNANYRGGPTMDCKATLVPVDGRSTFEFFRLHMKKFKLDSTPIPAPPAVPPVWDNRNNVFNANATFGFKRVAENMYANSHYQDTAKKDAHMKGLIRGLASLFARMYTVIHDDPIVNAGPFSIERMIANKELFFDFLLSKSDLLLDNNEFVKPRVAAVGGGLVARPVEQKTQLIMDGLQPLCHVISQRILDERPIGMILREMSLNKETDPIKVFDVLFNSLN